VPTDLPRIARSKARDYSFAPLATLSSTHPAAHWPKVAVTLTTDPYPWQLSEPSPASSMLHDGSGGATASRLKTHGTPMRLPSFGAPWNLRNRYRTCASRGSCVVLARSSMSTWCASRLPPAAPHEMNSASLRFARAHAARIVLAFTSSHAS